MVIQMPAVGLILIVNAKSAYSLSVQTECKNRHKTFVNLVQSGLCLKFLKKTLARENDLLFRLEPLLNFGIRALSFSKKLLEVGIR